jgi:hypothetical protein
VIVVRGRGFFGLAGLNIRIRFGFMGNSETCSKHNIAYILLKLGIKCTGTGFSIYEVIEKEHEREHILDFFA